MNKLYIIAVLLMSFTVMQGQITEMIIYETGGNTVTYQIANIDSIVYDTTAIATCGGTFTDSRDGEIYTTVSIGNQCWMAVNLRYDVPGNNTDTANSASPSTITSVSVEDTNWWPSAFNSLAAPPMPAALPIWASTP
jgi:hypothetical protein